MSGLGTAFSVLMVGHSLFGPTAPPMLEQALRAGQGEAQVQAQIINGSPLRYNWDQSATAEGVDAKVVLPRGETTHLILTEAIPLAGHLQWSETGTYARAFADLAAQANPDVHVYVQETWHSLKSGTGQAVEYDDNAETPWRQRLDDDLPAWEGILSEIAAGGAAHVSLIPAGQAMALLHDEIAAERIPGLPSISALFDDDIHLSDMGHYFVSMVQYATLTGQDPMGLPQNFVNRYGAALNTPGADLAAALQRVAWQAVQDYQGTAPVIQTAAERPAAPAVVLPETPAPDLTTASADAAPGTNAVAIGLASVADWSTQQPFLDIMKTARPWFGHRSGQWGGVDHADLIAAGALDANGWPTTKPEGVSSLGTLILTDMPQAATSLAGRYRLQFEGSGIIEVAGRARNVRYGKGEVWFDYTPGPGVVDIRIQRMARHDPPRNITVVKEDHIPLYEAGGVFNSNWTSRIAPFSAVRFMDWMEANNSALSTWDNRPLPDTASYAEGVPIEVQIDLANELGQDAWFNVPHQADDTFVRQFATLVRDGLDPGLTAYVEFSNEVWNWQFTQARWADEAAKARWGQNDKWMQYYGLRAAEVARIWSEVFAAEPEGRLINVISSQTGWLGLESEALEAPLAVAEGLPMPASAFDAYAITGYFGGILGLENREAMVKGWISESAAQARQAATDQGLTGAALQAYVNQHRYDFASQLAGRELTDGAVSGNPEDTLQDLITRVWPHHAAVARRHGLDLIMYEGGSHVVGIGPQVDDPVLTEFLIHFNYSAEMGALYRTLLSGWQAVGGQLFNAYSDIYAPTKWGSWGALRHLDDENPRWSALMDFQ